jgi:hypothetical protein
MQDGRDDEIEELLDLFPNQEWVSHPYILGRARRDEQAEEEVERRRGLLLGHLTKHEELALAPLVRLKRLEIYLHEVCALHELWQRLAYIGRVAVSLPDEVRHQRAQSFLGRLALGHIGQQKTTSATATAAAATAGAHELIRIHHEEAARRRGNGELTGVLLSIHLETLLHVACHLGAGVRVRRHIEADRGAVLSTCMHVDRGPRVELRRVFLLARSEACARIAKGCADCEWHPRDDTRQVEHIERNGAEALELRGGDAWPKFLAGERAGGRFLLAARSVKELLKGFDGDQVTSRQATNLFTLLKIRE